MISETERLGWAFLQTVSLPTLTCLVQSGKRSRNPVNRKSIILHCQMSECLHQWDLDFKHPIHASTTTHMARHRAHCKKLINVLIYYNGQQQSSRVLELPVGLYSFLAVEFGASSSLVQQHDATLQMRWDQTHRWAGHPPLQQQDLHGLQSHPETRTGENVKCYGLDLVI